MLQSLLRLLNELVSLCDAKIHIIMRISRLSTRWNSCFSGCCLASIVQRLSLGIGSIEKWASELCKTATKAALLSNILAATLLNYRKISVLLIYSELDCTLKREQKVVHETLPADVLHETGCHSPLRVPEFLFPLDNTVERGWPKLLHIWFVPSWSEKCNAYCSSCIFHELDLCEDRPLKIPSSGRTQRV